MAAAGGKDDHGVLAMIDTEEKQLQAINDLYLIVKAQPKYKKMKEPIWSPDTQPLQVITWLLRKLGPLAEGKDWTVDTFQEGKKMRYRFVVFEPYHGMLIKWQTEHIALDFLPGLRRRDLPLHNLFIDVIALISRYNKITLWDNDGDYSEEIEKFTRSTGGSKTAHELRELYTKGEAGQYLRYIKRRRRQITIESVSRMLARYKGKSEMQTNLAWWLRRGIDLARTKWDISINNFIPSYTIGNAVGPTRLYKFVWSSVSGKDISQNDPILQAVDDKMSKDMRKSGFFRPVRFTIAKPGQQLKDIQYYKVYKNSYSNTEFAVMLFAFLVNIRGHLKNRYRQYYYDSPRAKKKPNSPYLIDILATEQEEQIQITV